jgi:hypothetical protein
VDLKTDVVIEDHEQIFSAPFDADDRVTFERLHDARRLFASQNARAGGLDLGHPPALHPTFERKLGVLYFR